MFRKILKKQQIFEADFKSKNFDITIYFFQTNNAGWNKFMCNQHLHIFWNNQWNFMFLLNFSPLKFSHITFNWHGMAVIALWKMQFLQIICHIVESIQGFWMSFWTTQYDHLTHQIQGNVWQADLWFPWRISGADFKNFMHCHLAYSCHGKLNNSSFESPLETP